MNYIERFKFGLCLTMLVGMLAAAAAYAAPVQPLSKEQGDAIIKELQEIKQLLARPQQNPAMPPEAARPEKLTVKGGAIYALGKSDAPLTLVEFTDYECPFCKRFYDNTFQVLKKNYIDTGKLKFISRNMPLPMHPHALKAAQAAV
jgi:protein-disulfide isomerase